MNEPKFPVVLAVGLWGASALAVLTYTLIAYKETATKVEGIAALAADPLVASAAVLAAETAGPQKPLERGRFKKSKGQ